MNAMKRLLLTTLGSAALLLGLLGALLPGLPTTPFILVAAYCYAQASPRLHRWLQANPLFGPMVRDWEKNRSLSRRTKLIALGSMALMVGFSIWQFTGHPWWQGLLALLGLIGCIVVSRIPTRHAQASGDSDKS